MTTVNDCVYLVFCVKESCCFQRDALDKEGTPCCLLSGLLRVDDDSWREKG